MKRPYLIKPISQMIRTFKWLPIRFLQCFSFALLSFAQQSPAPQSPNPLGFDPYVTFAGNVDTGYHKTQFFEPNHNVLVGQWDSRANSGFRLSVVSFHGAYMFAQLVSRLLSRRLGKMRGSPVRALGLRFTRSACPLCADRAAR